MYTLAFTYQLPQQYSAANIDQFFEIVTLVEKVNDGVNDRFEITPLTISPKQAHTFNPAYLGDMYREIRCQALAEVLKKEQMQEHEAIAVFN